MTLLPQAVRAAKLALTTYALLSVAYTTQYFLLPLVLACLPQLSYLDARHPSSDHQELFYLDFDHAVHLGTTVTTNFLPPTNVEQFLGDTLSTRTGLTEDDLGREEHIVLSKIFAQTTRPTQVIPYYYRSRGNFSEDDLTVSTLVTSDRFLVFSRLVDTYHGPISATIYIPDQNTNKTEALLRSLHKLYTSSPSFTLRVDVHLARAAQGRQFNAWRNAARALARTEYVLALDVDFAICTDVREAVRSSAAARAALAGGAGALVVPAFEFTKLDEGKDRETFPNDKRHLLQLVQQGRIGMFHRSWEAGHNNTDYTRYYSAPLGAVYRVPKYQAAYEPYVIFRRDAPAWCDERFVGYGANKAACTFELHLTGMSFYVLADHFLIHQTHMYAEAARKNERKHNRKIYADFKEETCLRYLKRFRDDGTLLTPRGFNVRRECLKYKEIASLAADMLQSNDQKSGSGSI